MNDYSPHEATGVETVFSEQSRMALAIIIRSAKREFGIQFVTPDESVHQIGILRWPSGHVIDAHIHNPMERTIHSTQEVLFIKSGRVRVDLYLDDQTYQCSRILESGDVIFLASGGHGFEILDEAEIVEVKQGPYKGEGEKSRFTPQIIPGKG
ncbi:hypothetical protein N9M74_02455 [Pontimonas sp.]|nr:hypothetical protein [Pontimonas sp.]